MKKNLLLAGGGILAALFIAEVLLRLAGVTYPNFFTPDPVAGIAHRPGVEGRYKLEGESFVRINRAGLRDREHTREKPPGSIRVAVLGDSFTEAFQVPREDSFPGVMERRLSALRGREEGSVEVINFGTSAYGTAQELLTLRHRVWDYSPDVVLLAFSPANDISDNSRALKRRDYIPYFVYRGDSLVEDKSFLSSRGYRSRQGIRGGLYYGLVNHSRVMQLINIWRFKGRHRAFELEEGEQFLEPGLYREVYLPPSSQVWEDAWRVTEGLLLQMKRECGQKGADFFLVVLTAAIQVHPDASLRARFRKEIGCRDLFYPDRRLRHFAEKNGIPILTLAEGFQKYAEGKGVFFHGFGSSPGRGHWNKTAHRRAGETIARWLDPRLRSMAPGGRENKHVKTVAGKDE